MDFDEIAKACSRELVRHFRLLSESHIPKRPWLPEIYYFAARHTRRIDFEDQVVKLFHEEVISKHIWEQR